ncbi:hypothetical protein SCH_2063 [Salmonella enterica subsp. enterica serovar Choleraesuis str. SC-B67]|uniref:Uncharacterized protein n=1 Tax=Salmonella choleraesuis (strain SC-B67) TaxID=321314 RepID=Q57MU2_SALCH|nr:hypothetical protein SCH_2063 [Salmonella enterica subsp. enterica serovar Choleraesuis str. SC-B67]
MTLRPGDRASGELHHLAQCARHLLKGIFHGGNIAGQHHSAGKAVKKTNLHSAGFGGDIAGDNRRCSGR